ncbi:MAG TPA: hypothetical protein DEA58_04270 [Pseudothermotoga sp.]|uniref:PIG-L deacetylase family protein n=1 Tax=Pseudothermotoga lettingae TaxID=177758 RepID=UPI000746C095|nr:PIG-L family deacetylase [Pseudothermotoga lettingae]KUK20127.1 MAG: LmbE family protein [Pseudothermotoga lettingae]HBT25890.1 hypothetical protein [Pseudothermotoga sp.]
MKRVMIIGAHSDDPVIGAGGTIRELTLAGYEVYVVSVCGDRIEGFDEAIRFLGAKPIHFGFSYGQIDEESLTEEIERLVQAYDPDIIFTHWSSEILFDHELVSKHVLKIFRRREKEIFLFEIPASSLDFHFDVAVDITRSYEYRKKAIEIMKEAFSKEIFEKEILPSIIFPPGFRGIQVGCPYAEVFKHLGSRHPLSPYRRKLINIFEI